MQWLCYDLGEGEVAAVPYPWSRKPHSVTDMQTLCAVARTAIYDLESAAIVTADTEAEALAEARDLRERRMAAARMADRRGVPMMLDNEDGGLLHDLFVTTIDEAMEMHGGVQKTAAAYLGVSARALNHHLKNKELQHWRKITR